MKKYSIARGFTLIELLVVISIIGILASIVLVALDSARGGARDATRISELHEFRNAFEAINRDGNYYSTAGQPKCLGFTDGQTCWLGDISGSTALNSALSAFLPAIPKDPLTASRAKGNSYVYLDATGNVARHCDGSDYVNGPLLLWIPDKDTNPASDSSCKNMGFFACCGAVSCSEVYYCAYPVRP